MREGEEGGAPARAKRTGLGPIETALLLAVTTVVVLVSLPWVEVLARSDNQEDAVAIVRALGQRARHAPEAPLAELVLEDPFLAKCFGDLEALDGTDRLRCHGFLFDRPDPSGPDGPPTVELAGDEVGRAVLRAWPWRHGRTGTVAFLYTTDGRLLYHPNAEGRWEGPDRPPTPPFGPGWIQLSE